MTGWVLRYFQNSGRRPRYLHSDPGALRGRLTTDIGEARIFHTMREAAHYNAFHVNPLCLCDPERALTRRRRT